MILDRKILIREKLEKITKPLNHMKKKVVTDVTSRTLHIVKS